MMLATEARAVVLANPAPPPGAPHGEMLRWLTALVAGQLEVVREQVALLRIDAMFDTHGRPNPWITLLGDLMDIAARLSITQIRQRESLKSYEVALDKHQKQIVIDLVSGAVDAADLNAEQKTAFASALRDLSSQAI